MELSRRGVLKAGAALGGGLLVELWLPRAEAAQAVSAVLAPTAMVRVAADGLVTLTLNRVEMGQGTYTAQAQLVAEELEVDPRTMKVELSNADRVYDNPAMGVQVTGGSTSTATSFEPYREAGAVTRELLVAAAMRTWSAPRSECTATLGTVVHGPTKRVLRYGELVSDAAKLPIPAAPKLKTKLSVIGQPLPRLDAAMKVNGTAQFGIDVQRPDALVAVVLRCPVFGGTVKSFDSSAAAKLPGIKHVLQIPQGIAVVGTTYWHARTASLQVKVEWDEGPFASFDTPALVAKHRELVKAGGGLRVRTHGNVGEVWAKAARVLEAEYQAPFLAHTPMEPMNATAHVTKGHCEIWAPTQSPGMAKEVAQRILGYSANDVTVHTTFLGGGFGRRSVNDFIVEAVQVAKAVGVPVKVVWSREDDVKDGCFRPAATHFLKGALAKDGSVIGWWHGVATQSILAQLATDGAAAVLAGAPGFIKSAVAGSLRSFVAPHDPTAFEGADSLAYEIPNLAVDFFRHEPGAPVGPWRSVGHSHSAFATESFLDELAHAAGRDPFELRRSLLKYQHRHRWVLELAAEKAGWGTPLPKGVHRGIALEKSFGSWAAAVAEVSVEGPKVKVHRVVSVIDCGTVVNPDIVKSQLESATVFGLSAALKQRITHLKGRVQQNNFYDYEPLRLSECPRIETYIRENPAPPTGVGEPGVPVIAPAVANAIFSATGTRLRELPLAMT